MMPGVIRDRLQRLFDRFATQPIARRRALVAGAVWIALVTSYAIGFYGVGASQSRGTVFLDGMFFLIALTLPLVLVWLAAALGEELERQRAIVVAVAELASPLIGALEAARDTLERHGPASPEQLQKAVRGALIGNGRASEMAEPLERLAAGQSELRAGLRNLLAHTQSLEDAFRATAPAATTEVAPEPSAAPRSRKRKAPAANADHQPALPLLPELDASEGPEWDDLIKALDFPRDAEDRDGFRALKIALRHHRLAQMLQAAEDVLTLLSQEGIYMDDLAVEPGVPDDWRRFIEGARGVDVASVGGIRDTQALTAARGLMKGDPIFRDTALFLQRRFDVVLSEFAQGASDAQLLQMADTRSGRAFMLLARLSGSFD